MDILLIEGVGLLSKTRILLVDDEKELLALTKAYIEKFHPNIELSTSSSTNEALDLIKKVSFDTIISDYQMPTIDGLDFLARLRNSGNKTPFIMFTGRGNEEVAIQTLNLGGDYYLQKGGDPKTQFLELFTFIEKTVDKMQTEEMLERQRKAFQIIAEAAATAIDISDLCEQVLSGLIDLLAFQYGTIQLYNEKENILEPVVFAGLKKVRKKISSISVDDPNCISTFVFRSQEIVFAPDIQKHAIYKTHESRIREMNVGSIISCPILTSTQDIIGVLTLVHQKPKEISSLDINFVTSITELFANVLARKQIEEALFASRRRFNDIAENAVEWIWEIDSNGKYTYASSVVEKILGYTVEEILEKHFYDLFHPDDKNGLDVSSAKIIKDKKSFFRAKNRCLHKNGDEIWLLSSGVPILDKKGKLIGYRGIDSEITEAMKAERALKESENNFRLLAEKASDFIWTMNLDFELTYANPFVEQYVGYTVEEMLKLKLDDFLTPSSFKLAMFSFEDEMRIESLPDRDLKRTRSVELENRCKDGSKIWGETNFSFLRDPEGAVIGLIGVTRDITSRKQMEQKVKQQQQQILKQRDELDLFAGTIAHDLRGKIQAISLLNEMDDHKNRAVLAKQIDKMSLFITNLFLYAKKGEFIGEESDIDLKVLVERLVGKHYLDPSKQEVVVKKLPIIVGDPIRFAQLFDNLIRNVVKHSAATKVEIYSEKDKKDYRIFIRDNGKGISQENMQKIIKTLTTKEYSSFGFLIISKIVQAYCGDLVIESAEGKGTIVIISLPKECAK